MDAIRWTDHAEKYCRKRGIPASEVFNTINFPESIQAGLHGRMIYQRRYSDIILEKTMLLRVVVEESRFETVIVTVYKTSKLSKYSEGDGDAG